MESKVRFALLLTILALLVPALLQELDSLGPGVFKTRHVTITYDEGIWQSTARHYAEGMEDAYQQLVIKQGFRDGLYEWKWRGQNAFRQPAQVERSVAVHEFFHSIQMLGYPLSLADRFLIEGTAMWAMREVYPQCVKCYIEFLEDWLVGGTDASTLKRLSLGHQAGLFWNFTSDHYGGAQLIRQLFEHPDIRLVVDWPKVLSQLTKKSFLDLWAEFAVALAARQVPDAKWLYPRAEQKTSYVPVPVFIGEWTGQPLIIEQSNWENPYPQLCSEKRGGACPSKTSILSVGSNLAIRYPYGIHFLRVIPQSDIPSVLRFQGDPDSDFRVHTVARKPSGEYAIFPLAEACGIARPLDYALIQLVVTRSEKGSGTYQFVLQEPQIADFPLCHSIKVRP
jgi:hypothetical protein